MELDAAAKKQMAAVVMRRGAFCLFQSTDYSYRGTASMKVVMRRGAFCLFQSTAHWFIRHNLRYGRNAPRRILSISIEAQVSIYVDVDDSRNAPRRILSISM